MSKISVGTLIRIKPNVFYKGHDLSGRLGMVSKIEGYLMVEFTGIDEPVKILRYEVEETDVDLHNFTIPDFFDFSVV